MILTIGTAIGITTFSVEPSIQSCIGKSTLGMTALLAAGHMTFQIRSQKVPVIDRGIGCVKTNSTRKRLNPEPEGVDLSCDGHHDGDRRNDLHPSRTESASCYIFLSRVHSEGIYVHVNLLHCE